MGHNFFQVPGGIAEANGQLLRGDQIMAVNDKDLSQAVQDQVLKEQDIHKLIDYFVCSSYMNGILICNNQAMVDTILGMDCHNLIFDVPKCLGKLE